MIKAVIIDDSKLSHDIITNVINESFPTINISGNGLDVKSGIFAIKKHNPDIIFLDVEMPDGTGFDLLKSIKNYNFKLIFITAHEEYAINAIKFSTLDYLLKPLIPDEIKKAINTAIKEIEKENEQIKIKTFIENLENDKNQQKIILKTSNNIYVLKINEIIRCESDNNYTIFYLLSGQKIIVSKTLKQYNDLLINYNFLRIHKSHLVNIKYIKQYQKTKSNYVYLTDNSKIPVSVRKRETVYNALKNFYKN